MDQDADTESVENKFVNMHINMKKKPKNKGSKIKRILKKQCSIFYHIENSDMENIDDIKEDDNECNNDSDGGGARGK
jgi:hypothetical protein